MQADSWLVILILLHACIGKYSCRQFTLWKKLKFSSFLSCLLKLLMLTPVCTFFKQQWLLAEGYFIFFTPGYLTPGLRYITLPLMSCRDSVEAYSCFFASWPLLITPTVFFSLQRWKSWLYCVVFLLGVVCPLRREPQPVGKTLTNGLCNAPEFGILPLCWQLNTNWNLISSNQVCLCCFFSGGLTCQSCRKL